jgi:hypothetical protein
MIFLFSLITIKQQMSIVALKRKTQATYKNNSTGQSQFSINSTSRSQGFVGQTSLSRSLNRTILVGTTPKGSSACCGQFQNQIIGASEMCSFETPTVHTSTLSNKGFIATHYRWIRRPAPFTSVKPDSNLVLNQSNQTYVENLHRAVVCCVDSLPANTSFVPVCTANTAPWKATPRPYTKTSVVGGKTGTAYVAELSGTCQTNTTPFSVGVQRAPFAGFI